jgi:hypothetical protein
MVHVGNIAPSFGKPYSGRWDHAPPRGLIGTAEKTLVVPAAIVEVARHRSCYGTAMRRAVVVAIIAALNPRWVAATTTTAMVTTTTSTTSTTVPLTSPSTLCTCTGGVCEVKKGTYPVQPGSDLNFGTCGLTIDSGATIQLTSGAGAPVTIEAGSLTMAPSAQILGAPGSLAPDDGGTVSITVTGAILLDAGATIVVDAQDAGGSEIDLTSGGTITLGGKPGSAVLSAQASTTNGDGGTINIQAGGDVTIDIEPTGGDLSVTVPLSMPGSGMGSCGGTATLGVVGTGNVSLPSAPIDVSSDSCGGGSVFLNADAVATVPGEINADSNGTPLGGGFIMLTAETLTVGGKVHADGGGGEVNLQACDLTLSAGGQTLATGPNGFNLLQASGPMEIDGTMTAAQANTLDYLDPAHLPVLHSSTISPAAVVVKDNPPVPPLCPGQATTTTTASSTTTTTMPSSTTRPPTTTTSTSTTRPPTTTMTTSTSTTQPPTTSSTTTTTSSTRPPTTTTTAPTTTTLSSSTTSTSTTPVSTSTTTTTPDCTEESLQGFDAVDCHIDLLASLIAEQPTDIFGDRRVTQALLAHIGKARGLVDAARAGSSAAHDLRLAVRQLRTTRRGLARKAKSGETPADLALSLTTLLDQTIQEISQL